MDFSFKKTPSKFRAVGGTRTRDLAIVLPPTQPLNCAALERKFPDN